MKSDATFSRRNRSSAGMGQIPLGRKRQRRRTTTCKKWSANKSKAAELLGITREGLRKKLLRMGINDKELPHDDGKA